MQQPVSFPADEALRLGVLHSLDVLETATEPTLDGLAACAARLLGCAAGFVVLVGAERQWIKGRHGWPAPASVSPEASFCAHVVAHTDLLEIPDALLDPRFAGHPLVSGAPHLRFYAGEPLRVDGYCIGTLCVADTVAHRLAEPDREALRQLARAAAELLTQRRLMRQQQAEQQRLLDFARASGDWMWETDADGRYTWISGAFEPITGVPPSALIGERAADSPLLTVEGRPAHNGSLHELLAQGRPFSRALTQKLTPYGTLVVSRSAVPVHDAQGRLLGWRGTARDMTARIAAAEAARARDERLHKLAEQIPGLVYQYRRDADGHGSFIYLSERVREMHGVTPERVLEDAGQLFGLVHPDDAAGFEAAIARSQRELSPLHYEMRVVLGDGQVRWREDRAMPERLADGGTLWHGFSADVTERKEMELALRHSEERWGMAAAAAGIGIAQLDLASGLLQFDAQACLNHGLGYPHGPFSMAAWMAQIEPEDRASAEAGLQRAVNERSTLEARYRIRRSDGALRWLEILARAHYDDSGQAVSVIGTCRDVTEQQVADQLRRDKLEAERASRAKTSFLSRVSHELRTPLNGILGFAQLMDLDREHALAPVQQQRLSSVQRAGRHLLELINDVLDLARIEREDFSLQPQPVALASSLQGCVALMAPLAAARGVGLAPAPATRLWVRADARAFEQVLMNLLSNAIKYNRNGGRVWVTLEADADKVRLAVHDTGPGLDAQQRARLFQPFARLGAEVRRIEGSGLGLVIARQLTEAMGGMLDVHSEPGVGSAFRVTLPRSAPTTVAADTPAALPAAASITDRPRRVVYVEDEPLNVVLMQELFRARPQWQLDIAVDAAHGLALARSTPVDLMLIDMNLPDMNGLQLLGRLRADTATRGLRCIALSADAMPEQVARARAAGFDDYWTKPFEVQRLLSDLGRLLG